MSGEDSQPSKVQKLEEVPSKKYSLNPYLYFPGNAGEAIDFYAKVFNATVPVRSTFANCPGGSPSEEVKDKILHASIQFGTNTIMISDASMSEEATFGNAVQLCIVLTDPEETATIFKNLGEGGKVKMPLERQFWGALFGMIVDKFGVIWSLNCDVEKQEESK